MPHWMIFLPLNLNSYYRILNVCILQEQHMYVMIVVVFIAVAADAGGYKMIAKKMMKKNKRRRNENNIRNRMRYESFSELLSRGWILVGYVKSWVENIFKGF
jgi:hypothetical protein